ncbi:hypothetical protein CBR_g12603 [Chara braunii]|uniref:Core-2/I-branching beta-1,6-N-acetylglucosaminyltransferase family protein n=1 Tax=Chara braunii TaxID=69332 RepID=A0A388KSH0_CHABU|nr:hypothetical protein CBR_g12603 [Chara braunii]|eukprot:GBG72883.1 hypothetical protein CBR_g12603 [Chara braunii]
MPPPLPPPSQLSRRGFSSPIWICLLLSNVFFAGILFGVSICVHYPTHFQAAPSSSITDLRRDLLCLLRPPLSSSPARAITNGEHDEGCDPSVGPERLPALQGTFYRILVPLAGGGPRRGLEKKMCLRLASETFRLLSHVLSDEELLSLGSANTLRPVANQSWPSKVAFLFLTRGPLPFAPLWQRFFRGHEDKFSVYVHATPGFSFSEDSPEVFQSAMIRSQKVRWGEPSLVDAERRLLATALVDFQNQRFVLLSESCVPITNFTYVYKYLMGTNKSFTDCINDQSPWGRGRYRWEMMPEIHIDQWRKGAQWFGLNRQHAVAVISDSKYYPKLRKYCVPHCYVDEHYLPTMLSIIDARGLANRTTTYTDWSRGGQHPRTFSAQDITAEFIRSIQNDARCTYNGQPNQPCWLFARKFEPSALHPLMKTLQF